jgi:NADH-quinone oxidoreductase subunit A
MFDIETVFLYPWAVISRSLGVYGLLSIAVFLFILILGLAYAWRKGALQWK